MLVTAVGCKRSGVGKGAAGFPLAPVSQGQPALIGTLTWPSVEGSLADVAAVAGKLGLPFSAENAKGALLAKVPSPDAIKQIDLAKPLALVFFADPPSTARAPADAAAGASAAATQHPYSGVAAFAPRAGAPTTADGWAKLLGTVVERRQDAISVRPPAADAGARDPEAALPETLCVLVRDGAVLLADGWKSLEQGGAIALAARGSGARAPILSLRPEGIARSQGTTLAAAIGKAHDEIRKGMTQTAAARATVPSPVIQAMVGGMMDTVSGWLQSTEAVELSATLDDRRGLSITSALRPRRGTPLAQIAASAKPYVAEPALLAGKPAALLAAGGEAPLMQKELIKIFKKGLDAMPAIPGDPGNQARRDELRRLVDLASEAWTGAGTVAFRLDEGLSYDIVYEVVPALGKTLVETLAKVVGPSPFGDLGAVDPSLAGSTYVLDREDDVFWWHLSRAKDGKRGGVARRPGKVAGAASPASSMSALLSDFEVRLAVDGGKMIATVGPDSKARLTALRSAVKSPAPAPSAPAAAALAATKGAWFFEAIDLGELFKGFAKMAALPGFKGTPASAQQAAMASAMLGNAHLALLADLRGGETFSFTFRVPIETATSVMMLAAPLMASGAGLGAQASPASPLAPAPKRHHRR